MKTPKYISSRGYFSFLVGSLAVGQMTAFAIEECYYDHETSGFDSRQARIQLPHSCEEEEVEVPDGVIGLLRQLPSITINGSHHRLLLDTPVGENGWHTWLTGDFTTHDQLNADQSVFEIGASRNVEIGGQSFRVGLAYGHASVDQDFSLGGGSNIEGNFGLAEVDYKIPDSKFIVSGLLYYGEWNADVTRGYSIGPGLSSRSKGSTDIDTLAYRLRIDWKDAYVNDKISITPRLSYTGMDTTGDAYTESGGTAPSAFGEQDYVDHEARIGADIDYVINDSTQLRTILEIAHRFDKKGTVESGGGGGPTIDIKQGDEHDTWGRLGFELSHSFDERQLVRAAVFGATKGEDATVSGAISYNYSF